MYSPIRICHRLPIRRYMDYCAVQILSILCKFFVCVLFCICLCWCPCPRRVCVHVLVPLCVYFLVALLTFMSDGNYLVDSHDPEDEARNLERFLPREGIGKSAESRLGCAGFGEKNVFASKRNEAKWDPFRMCFARSCGIFFFASFRFKFFASDQSEINRAYFCFVLLPKIVRFAPFLFCFRFSSFSFRFRCENKRKKIFSHRSEKILLSFRFISLQSENDGSFSLPFRFISLRSENDGSFSLLFRFDFASFHFRFASYFCVLHRSEKNFASKRKWRRTLISASSPFKKDLSTDATSVKPISLDSPFRKKGHLSSKRNTKDTK